MTTTTSKMLERIPLEVLNKSDFALIDEIYATDFVEHTPQPGVPPTREGFKQTAIALKKAFPDLYYTVEDTIESGDRLVHRLSASGTMTGEFMGIPASGRKVTISGIDVHRLRDGKMAEHWHVVEELQMLQQLGVIPMPQGAPS